jgi:hypothetical protein
MAFLLLHTRECRLYHRRRTGSAYATNSSTNIPASFSSGYLLRGPIFPTTDSICLAECQGFNSPELPGGIMSTLEAILLGAMLAYTPAIIVLAASLWNIPELEKGQEA